MLGKQEYQPKLFSMVQLESLIPKDHLLRKLDEALDLSFVRPLVEPFYSKSTGRPSVDPEIFVRMLLIRVPLQHRVGSTALRGGRLQSAIVGFAGCRSRMRFLITRP